MSRSGNDLARRVDRLRGNRTSGALDLALEAIALAQDWTASGADPPALAAQLETMHPGIATVRNVGRLLLDDPPTVWKRLRDLEQSLRGGNQRIAAVLQEFIARGAKIITLSNSSTVREALVTLCPAYVAVMESLPGGEGHSMFRGLEELLGASGAHVELIPDAAIGNVVPQVDCALVGIDTFDSAGAIYHKVGTLPLALCCRRFHKPLYAAGHSLKQTDQPLGPIPEPGKLAAAQVFDRTPAELISRIVTEE